MPQPQPLVAIIRAEGDKIAVSFPFNEACKEALKGAIPYQQREFKRDPARWVIDPAHLDEVRRIIAEQAAANGWRVEDHTARSAEEIAAEQAADDAAALEQHVAAFLAVLPQLPARSLALVSYDRRNHTWELELREHLGEELFRSAVAASVHGRREHMLIPFDHKRGWGYKLQVAADERLLRALIARGDVQYLKVHQLTLVATLDGGAVAHLEDADGRAYLGGRWDTADLSRWNFVSRSWPVAVVSEGIYIVFAREDYVGGLLTESSIDWAGFGGAFAVAFRHSSNVVRAVRAAHIEDWFVQWAKGLLDAPAPALPAGVDRGRAPHNYTHPADDLLAHFGFVDEAKINHAADLAALLGWTGADILAHRARVEAWKRAAAAAKLADLRQRAQELARPLLAALTKDALLELATRHGLAARKSARKDELVDLLAGCQAACEDVLKLPLVEQ